jgi:hypothetical protein
MISIAEFQQKLDSGQVHAALALLVRDGAELDITTQIGAEIGDQIVNDQAINHTYLRTKINLLTGSVQNEVGEDLTIGSPDYLQLHQLHLDRIVISHQIIQGYQDSLKEILLTLSSSSSLSPLSPIDVPQPQELAQSIVGNRLNSDLLMAKLIQSSVPGRDDRFPQVELTAMGQSSISQPSIGQSIPTNQSNPINQANLINQDQQSDLLNNSQTNDQQQYFPHINPMAEDIDLSIVHEDEVWEEWIQDEEIASLLDSPAPLGQTGSSVAPDRSGSLTRRQLHPIEVKPMMPRQSKSIETSVAWSQFVPEHLGIAPDLY